LIALLALLSWVPAGPPDTLLIRPLRSATPPVLAWDSSVLGPPQVQFETGQARVLVWLFRWRDTVFLRATIPDSTPYWGDDFVISLDTRGDAASSPQHDDFQWYFRRVTDSSVIYRGREGRWQAPRGDPDWRLGRERTGGGWEVNTRNERREWSLLLRLDPAWFTASEETPRIAFRTYDNEPGGWTSWPPPLRGAPATTVEQAPVQWAVVRTQAMP
jgi:hypothetical protein